MTWMFLRLLIIFYMSLAACVGRSVFADDRADVLVIIDSSKSHHQTFAKEFVRLSIGLSVLRQVTIRDRSEIDCAKERSTWIIAVGLDNLSECLPANRKNNVLGVFVSKNSLSRFGRISDSENTFSAIILDQPVNRQVAVAKALFPRASRIAMIADSDSLPLISLDTVVENIELVLVSETTFPNVKRNVEELIRRSDVVITLPKSHDVNVREAKWLLNFEYQNKTPVFGFSDSYVQAGAVGATFSTPEHFARQSIEWVVKRVQKSSLAANIESPKYFRVSLNASVIEALNMHRDIDLQMVDRLARTETFPDDIQYAGDGFPF